MQAQDSTDPTGVKEVVKNNAPTIARARERKALAALELKVSGFSWDQIAETVGYPTPRQALVAVEKALEGRLDVEDRSKLRKVASMRLEALLQSVMPKANDANHPEHLAAQTTARGHIDRWIKLNGLDAPAELVVHTPTAAQLDAWVARVVSSQVGDVQEDDIVEGEWSEDRRALPAG